MKRLHNKASKGKGKLWKKGQSSSFKPDCNKHRQAAKKRAAFGNRGEGNLTESVLAQHNKLTTENLCDGDDDVMSIGGDTALTAFTNCSLPSFNRLMKNWNTGSFLHKEMVAVLAAVTEILKTSGVKENETEYFAALMTTLDVVDTDEGVTAVICLLSMLIKRLNESVLKTQSKVACETFMKLLIKYMNSDHCALLKNLLNIVYAFLKVKTQWAESNDELNVVLEFTTHHKPKVRRSAQYVIRTLLTDHVPESSTYHPCSSHVAKFCIEKLETSAGKLSSSKDTFYILSLLQEVIYAFPSQSIKKSSETVFKVMTLSNSMVTLHGLKALQGLFSFNRKLGNLPAELNARLITALYDYQPNVKDSDCLITWIQLMEKALVNLSSLDEKLCFSHLPKFYTVAVKCWLNDMESVMQVVAVSLKNILQNCVKPTSEIFQNLIFEDPVNNCVHKMFHSVEEALSYQYHKAWRHVLSTLGAFFEVVGKHCYTAMMKCLQSLGDLHDSYNFPHISVLEKSLGIAIQHMGPNIVLKAIPLRADCIKPDFPKSWLLPLLRDYVKKTELEYFVKQFLPLAAKMRNRALVLRQEGKMVESKLFEVVCSQIWSLLPGFCTEPTDLKQCFREVARTLGIILRDDPSLRMTVLSSLRLLINKNLENDENKEEIAKYAKNYIPILFNLYTTEAKDKVEEKMRLAVFETIKVYLQITDKEMCSTFFSKSKEKLMSSESEIFMQHALIDLCKAMIPCINETQIQELWEYCKPLLKHANHTVQKKAYSVIKEICSSETESSRTFVKAQLEDLRVLLSGSKTGLTPATRALRLNALQCIVSHLDESEKPTVLEIIPEAVLCTKENSIKARTAAYELLVEIGHALHRFMPGDKKGPLMEYLTLLRAGLGGSPHLMSATILAIGRIVYEFKDELDSDLIGLVTEDMCTLVQQNSREIVVAALSSFKVLFASVDTNALAQHVKSMVKSLTSMAENNQRPYRFKAKEIFTRLVRKFGYEMISKMVPEGYRKQLANIRKLESRKQHKKDDDYGDRDNREYSSKKRSDDFDELLADSDDDLLIEEDVRQKVQKSRGKKVKAPCLEENGEDDIVDFLDPAVNKRLLNLHPVKEVQQKKTSDSFPVAEDGRFIIEDEDNKKSKTKQEKDEKNAVLAELGASLKRKKRKFGDSDDEDDDHVKERNSNSQGVQKGIHRSLGPNAKRNRPGEEFKSKKGGGDVKKGKVEPYAYLPLDRQALNKRKQVKLKGQFKNIVKAAKKGASIGMKKKARESKKWKRNIH